MNFVASLQSALEVVKLNRATITALAQNKDALQSGLLIVAIAGILSSFREFSVMGVVTGAISAVIGSFIGYGFMHLIAKAFKAKVPFTQFYTVASHSVILNWLYFFALIPNVGIIIPVILSMWGVVMSVVIVETVYKIKRWKAIVVALLIPFLLFVVVVGIVGYLGILTPQGFLPQG